MTTTIKINNTPPPRPKWSVGNTSPHRAVIDTAKALRPGEWFHWPEPVPTKAIGLVSAWRRHEYVGEGVFAYKDAESGRVVVLNIPEDQNASDFSRYRKKWGTKKAAPAPVQVLPAKPKAERIIPWDAPRTPAPKAQRAGALL